MIKFNSFVKITFLVLSFVLAVSLYKSWIRNESMRMVLQHHSNSQETSGNVNNAAPKILGAKVNDEAAQKLGAKVSDEAAQTLGAKVNEVTEHFNSIMKELDSAKDRIKFLEEEIEAMSQSIPKKFPNVKFLNYRTKKRILVTGGAGFVGSHLVDRLMLAGHEVIVVDNFFTGRKRNVEQWIGHANFELIHQDIVNPLYIEVDEIYHLASPASPPHYMFNPVKTIKTNTIGTINMLGLAKRGTAKILIASTSEIYGDPQKHPQDETYWGHVNPIGPRACYDEGKRVSETLSYAYAKQEQVEVRVARIFNTYGPRMHMNDGRVVSNFILQALQNETLTIYGHGNQTRSFQYVSDLVDGLIALMDSNYSQPVNLGNPTEHTIQEFAEIIKRLVGSNTDIKQIQAVEDDPQRRKPDITRAKEYLNWRPKVSLEDGLQKTIAYFRDELRISLKGQTANSAWIDNINEVVPHR